MFKIPKNKIKIKKGDIGMIKNISIKYLGISKENFVLYIKGDSQRLFPLDIKAKFSIIKDHSLFNFKLIKVNKEEIIFEIVNLNSINENSS